MCKFSRTDFARHMLRIECNVECSLNTEEREKKRKNKTVKLFHSKKNN